MDGNAHDPAVQVLGHVRLVTLLFSLMEISFKCRAVCTATHIFVMARVNHNVLMNSGLFLCVSISEQPMTTYRHWFICPIWCGSSFSGLAIINLFSTFQVL